MNTIVSIVKCEYYDQAKVMHAVRQALDIAELQGSFDPRQNVLLKPNLLSARLPEEAVTTHPSVVAALGRIALDAGCDVGVGDSPPFAGETQSRYSRLCERTGITTIAAELGIPIVRFEEEVSRVASPDGRYYKSFELAAAVTNADIVVNMPKLKTHGLTGFSGAVKNIFGCIPGIRKGLFHVQASEDREAFAQMLVDLLAVVRPSVNVMDAIIGMEGEGPNSGTPRQIGVILASSDPVAMDAVACAMVGIDPFEILTTRLAHEQGLGCGDLSCIEVRGEQIEASRITNFKRSSGASEWARIPAPIRAALRRQLVASPRIKTPECIGCGDCSRVCPVKAITPGKPPTINLDACIRCYCCHEVCNLHAIDLHRGWLARILRR